MNPVSGAALARLPSAMASPMRTSSWCTTRPAPMFMWPTSELPICPSGKPTSRPEVCRKACGQDCHSLVKVGVLARRTALSSVASRQPKPSRITSITGRIGCGMGRALLAVV